LSARRGLFEVDGRASDVAIGSGQLGCFVPEMAARSKSTIAFASTSTLTLSEAGDRGDSFPEPGVVFADACSGTEN
jgi:hypothetical protein